MSRALARDRLGVPAVLFFVLAGVAPLTVAAGVIPTAYATTGLTGSRPRSCVVAVILALFATGYVAMTRHITNAGAFYAFIARGLGRVAGVAAALVALLAYSFLQVGLYGAFGPNAASEAAAHLGLHAAWWVWALAAWAADHRAGPAAGRHHRQGPGRAAVRRDHRHPRRDRLRAGSPGRRAAQLRRPCPRRADLGRVRHRSACWRSSPCSGSSGSSRRRCWPRRPRHPRRTIPVATYLALGAIAVVYAAAAWAMAAHAGQSHVVAAAGAQGPGLLFGLGGSARCRRPPSGCS